MGSTQEEGAWVHSGRWVWLIAVVLLFGGRSFGQYTPPSDQLVMRATKAVTWNEGPTTIIQFEVPVEIDLDQTKMTAKSAVVWLTPLEGVNAGQHRVEMVLVGDAKLTQPEGISRSAPRLSVSAQVRERVVLNAERVGGDRSNSELFKQSKVLRREPIKGGRQGGPLVVAEEPLTRPPLPASRPAMFRPQTQMRISMSRMQMRETPEGTIAAVLEGPVLLRQQAENGDYLTLQSDRAVIFTPYRNLSEVEVEAVTAIGQAAESAYLEGDVRITRTPADEKLGEQKLTANRVYYEFTTDRAVLTDVVLQTMDPKTSVPLFVRAKMVRQLSEHEYTAEKAKISTSGFHTPSIAIGASRTYVRQSDFENEVTGARTYFQARNATLDVEGIPIFYTPFVSGTVVQHSPLREAELTNSRRFGFGVMTEWGLFESLGLLAPKGLDLSYHLDYFSERGPATGFDGKYKGGFITETTLQPWTYEGEFMSYLLFDEGVDDFGRRRRDVRPEDELRGRFYLEHQHFFPSDWQMQFSGGYISDHNFMEQWFNREFRSSRSLETALYAKRQSDSEAYSFLFTVQPNNFTTVSELYQEQFEIERLPEISYLRIGDSFWQDRVTFFSNNSISAIRFDPSSVGLDDLGFRPRDVGFASPGLPSLGQTGAPDDRRFRGDFRQELNWPFTMGVFRTVPYVVGRYTGYSEGVGGTGVDRLSSAAGIRMTTAFWKVNDRFESQLFDVHRLRHVIEPHINLYAGAQNRERHDILIYDESVDAVSGISAVSVAINQRWQTKRGGPGRWRSVDFFKLNIEANHFINQPPASELEPIDFRGLFFMTQPETSVARNSINLDSEWMISDFVIWRGGAEYNLDEDQLATAHAGFSVRHSPRLSYTFGWRHIGLDFAEVVRRHPWIDPAQDPSGRDLLVVEKQDLIVLAASYELTAKYRLNFANSYDLAQSRNDRSIVSVVRQFDKFYVSISFRVDDFQGENSVSFNVWPEGMAPGRGSQGIRGAFGN